MIAKRRAAWVCILMLWGAVAGAAQEASLEDRLVAYAETLRMGLTLATVAAHAPTIVDLRLHAQQLVNLIEGGEGRHFVRPAGQEEAPLGLAVEIQSIRRRFDGTSLSGGLRAVVVVSADNVATFLNLAVSATLDAMSQRRLDEANLAMLRAYACLLAAYVPGLGTILRAYGLATRIEAAT